MIVVSGQLPERLHAMFENVPLELKKIDVVRELRLSVDSEKLARLRCVTVPTGISIPGGKLLGEHDYPRSYVVDLAWPLHDPEITQCVAQATWHIKSERSELESGNNQQLKRFDLGFDPFDLMDMGAITPNPGREIAFFAKGFIDPDIRTQAGLENLLNTRGAIDG